MAEKVYEIDRDQVRSLMAKGAQLVEVLSSKAYNAIHLAGAKNIPLAGLNRETAAQLRRNQRVIVYCADDL
ncbi:MAG TPA: rhodanese-like domain-containing protein [Anaerolineales bacterium]|jgi:rhodanese-related sulfurtransferase